MEIEQRHCEARVAFVSIDEAKNSGGKSQLLAGGELPCSYQNGACELVNRRKRGYNARIISGKCLVKSSS